MACNCGMAVCDHDFSNVKAPIKWANGIQPVINVCDTGSVDECSENLYIMETCYRVGAGARQTGFIVMSYDCVAAPPTGTFEAVLDVGGNIVPGAIPVACVDSEAPFCLIDDSNTQFWGVAQYEDTGAFIGMAYFTVNIDGTLTVYIPTSTPRNCDEADLEETQVCRIAISDDTVNTPSQWLQDDQITVSRWFDTSTNPPTLTSTIYLNESTGIVIANPIANDYDLCTIECTELTCCTYSITTTTTETLPAGTTSWEVRNLGEDGAGCIYHDFTYECGSVVSTVPGIVTTVGADSTAVGCNITASFNEILFDANPTNETIPNTLFITYTACN